jgi:hypothetical protein
VCGSRAHKYAMCTVMLGKFSLHFGAVGVGRRSAVIDAINLGALYVLSCASGSRLATKRFRCTTLSHMWLGPTGL